MKKTKPLDQMTDEEFERYLKKQGLTGIGAWNVSLIRKNRIASKKNDLP